MEENNSVLKMIYFIALLKCTHVIEDIKKQGYYISFTDLNNINEIFDNPVFERYLTSINKCFESNDDKNKIQRSKNLNYVLSKLNDENVLLYLKKKKYCLVIFYKESIEKLAITSINSFFLNNEYFKLRVKSADYKDNILTLNIYAIKNFKTDILKYKDKIIEKFSRDNILIKDIDINYFSEEPLDKIEQMFIEMGFNRIDTA